MTERLKELLRDRKEAKKLLQGEIDNTAREFRVNVKNVSMMTEESEDLLQDNKESEEAIQREIEEAVSEYRAGIKKDLLNRFSHLIAANKESGKYFFMGHWLKKNEISDFYQYIKKKDNVFIFYLVLCMFILLVLNFLISISFLSGEQLQMIFSSLSKLF